MSMDSIFQLYYLLPHYSRLNVSAEDRTKKGKEKELHVVEEDSIV